VSIYKRGRIFQSNIVLDGARHQQSLKTSNRRQAEAIEQKIREELINKRFRLPQVDLDITFGQLALKFLASPAATKYHQERIRQVLTALAETRVCDLTRGDLAAYRATRTGDGVTDATVNRDLSVLRRVINWAVDEGIIPQNPLGRIRMARERRVRRSIMQPSEEDMLIQHAPEHLKRMIVCALDTGMRRGEITSQRWEDVDFPQNVLYVTHSKTPEGESREIPLTKRLHALLLSMRKDSGLIFTYDGQEPLASVKKAWKSSIRRAGIRYTRFHDLRHTFNSRLMEAGVMQEVRMALMGHSGGSSINLRYTHVEIPRKRDAISRLEAWVKQQRQQLTEGGTNASTQE
jgi:integrase